MKALTDWKNCLVLWIFNIPAAYVTLIGIGNPFIPRTKKTIKEKE